jgi:hypothetical protein
MTEAFEVSAFFPGQTAEKIYNAWLDSQAHTAMTGAPACSIQKFRRVRLKTTARDGRNTISSLWVVIFLQNQNNIRQDNA